MSVEQVRSFGPLSNELPAFDLAGHIARSALHDPTYHIDYTHPDLIDSVVEALSLDERLDVDTPTVYARGSNVGHQVLRVSTSRAPLAEVIPLPHKQ